MRPDAYGEFLLLRTVWSFVKGSGPPSLMSVVSSALHAQSLEAERSQMGIQEKHRDEPLEYGVC